MTAIAVIPARGGSKGIPGKNLRTVGGVPLVVRAVTSALRAGSIDRVIVSTDDESIADAARGAGAEVVVRPGDLAGDTASSESAILHALRSLDRLPRAVVFVQATSPFIDPDDLDQAVDRVLAAEYDVVFSAVETYAFLWRETPNGAEGVNHDPAVRPMRQEREPHYRETGAFYVMQASGFVEAGHRFFGRVGVQLVDERSALDIDTHAELELADTVAPLLDPRAPTPHGTPIDVDVVVTDFDGVHTDDTVHVGADGSEFVTVSRSDGMGVQRLRDAGIPVLILSTEVHPVVRARARKLQIDVLHGLSDKAEALVRWTQEHGVPLERVAYLGNDVNDLGAMRLVGWPVSVPQADPEVLAAARVVLTRSGGRGAVRELAECVLRATAGRGPAVRAEEETTVSLGTVQEEESWSYASETTR